MKTVITVMKGYEFFFKVEMERHHPNSMDVEKLCESFSAKYPKPAFTINVVWWNEISEPFRLDSIIDAPEDLSVITCTLCTNKMGCEVIRDVLAPLDVHRAIGTIGKDFDDIMVDLAAICHNFKGES
jgi:hypothetical protein